MTDAERKDLYRRCLQSGFDSEGAAEFVADEVERRAADPTEAAVASIRWHVKLALAGRSDGQG